MTSFIHPTVGTFITSGVHTLGSKINISDVVYIDMYKPVGGRIFYIHEDNGATYHFYDASGNELTDQTVEGLTNAVSYTIKGIPSADKFYVYNDELATDKNWGWQGTQIGSSGVPPYGTGGIGYGKLNTTAVLDKGTPTDYQGSIWQYVTDLNTSNTGGCNDWFIGSDTEQDKLRESGLVDWYSSNFIWSSVELGVNNSSYWFFRGGYWDYGWKTGPYTLYCCVGFRSF